MNYSEIKYNPEENKYSVSKIDGEYITKGPLNVGFQITRRCNLKCIYCAESAMLPEMSLAEIEKAFINLKNADVSKINITGGEPLVRKDLKDIINLGKNLDFYLTVGSNAVLVDDNIADFLSDKLVYFESTLDGSRKLHNSVRGKYNEVINGMKKISARKIPLHIAMVLLNKSVDDAKHVMDVAQTLNAQHVKFLIPIYKGRGKTLPLSSRNNTHLDDMWAELCEYKNANKFNYAISLADWRKIGTGAVILVNANGDMVASPSFVETTAELPKNDSVEFLGNILEDSVKTLWKHFPYKDNHIKKYTFETMLSQT